MRGFVTSKPLPHLTSPPLTSPPLTTIIFWDFSLDFALQICVDSSPPLPSLPPSPHHHIFLRFFLRFCFTIRHLHSPPSLTSPPHHVFWDFSFDFALQICVDSCVTSPHLTSLHLFWDYSLDFALQICVDTCVTSPHLTTPHLTSPPHTGFFWDFSLDFTLQICLDSIMFLATFGNPTRFKWTNFANFFFRGFIYQYSFTIYTVPELRYFSYEYATFFLEVHFFSQILHDSPLNYCQISLEFTFDIQDALGFVIKM